MFSTSQNSNWQHRAAAGGLLLVGVIGATAFGADAPAAPPPASATASPACRHGDVDLAKMNEHAAKMFAAVDANADGKITQEEFLAAKPPHDGPMGGHSMGGGDMMGGAGMGSGMAMGPGTGAGAGTGLGPGNGMGPGAGMGSHAGMAEGMAGGAGMGGPGMGMGPHGPDGWMTPQDREKFQAELFKALDTDHNGQLSEAEFGKAMETAHTLMKTQMFTKFDKNGDGVLTKDEFPPFVQKMTALDTNKDGTVTCDEMKAARAAKGAQTGNKPN